MAFITTSAVTTLFVRRHHSTCTRDRTVARISAPSRHVRMGMGEDGLTEDLSAAQNIIENGSTVEVAKEMMTKLEYRRAVLAHEVTEIEDTIELLTKSLHSEDQNVLEQAMEAALSMFKPSDDNYPSTGIPSGYTMDKPKK